MKLRFLLLFTVLLFFSTIFMVSQTAVVSSAAEPARTESQMATAPNGAGISITGPLEIDQGDNAVYTISYVGLEATNGIKFEFTGINALTDTNIISATPATYETYPNPNPDSIVWAFEDLGASGSITIEVQHKDCGAIGHRATIIDSHPDPNSTEIVAASSTTLVDCPPTPTPTPTATPINEDYPPGCEPTIISTGNGYWYAASSWDLGRVPNSSDVVWVQEGHQIIVHNYAVVRALCNEGTLTSTPLHSVVIIANDYVTNYETGTIQAEDGEAGIGSICGKQGGSVIVYPLGGWYSGGVAITNLGTIQAGHGGDGEQCAGNGGSTKLYGRNTYNSSTICAGDGGDLTGNVANRRAGRGGDTHVWGKFGGWGYLFSTGGPVCAGNGGDGNAAGTNPQHGGRGGYLKLISLPFVYLAGGPYSAGQGGDGVNGGSNGWWGWLFIEPNGEIVFDSAQVSGGNVQIFGGNNWVLDLNNSNNHSTGSGTTITATESITLAVGTDGIIDLRGNTGTLLQAGNAVNIYSDNLLDDGNLGDIIDASEIMTDSARILRDLSIGVPETTGGEPGVMLTVTVSILNDGPEEDTYDLTITDSEGWTIGNYPSSVTVGGLEAEEFVLEITPPGNSTTGNNDYVTIVAVSEDGEVSAEEEVQVHVKYPPEETTAVTVSNTDALAGMNWYLPALALLLIAAGLLLTSGRMVLVARQK